MEEKKITIEIKNLVDKWKEKEGNLIMILHEIQNHHGYVPRELALELSGLLDVPLARIYEVITFYNFFKLTPPGKHKIAVCMGTACHLAGGRLILEALERELSIKVGETAEDGNFSLERVACIGCCMLAPVVVIKDKIHPKMTPFKVEEALIPYKQEAQGELKEGKSKSKS